MNIKTIYLAGGLFNAGERLHNLYLEKYLKQLGYKVQLPQRRALHFFGGELFNVANIAKDCAKMSASKRNIYVGNSDGADADSGTCVEFGVAISSTGRAVVYRTDFRTAEDRELGANSMLKIEGSIFVYCPCFFTELKQVNTYYKKLAQKIHQGILSLNLGQ